MTKNGIFFSFFYCCVTDDHKFSCLKQLPLIIHISEGQKSRQAQLDYLLRVLQGWSQKVTWGLFLPKFIHIVDWIQSHGLWDWGPHFLAGRQQGTTLSVSRLLSSPCLTALPCQQSPSHHLLSDVLFYY